MLKIRTACESDLPQIMMIEKSSFAPQIQESQNVFLERMKLCPKMFLIFYEADKNETYTEIFFFILPPELDKHYAEYGQYLQFFYTI